MAKIYTEITVDRVRRMRFGYKIVKLMDSMKEELASKKDHELMEFLLYLALKEDDSELLESQIEDLLDEYGVEIFTEALDKTLRRDMPGLASKIEENKSEKGTESPNE